MTSHKEDSTMTNSPAKDETLVDKDNLRHSSKEDSINSDITNKVVSDVQAKKRRTGNSRQQDKSVTAFIVQYSGSIYQFFEILFSIVCFFIVFGYIFPVLNSFFKIISFFILICCSGLCVVAGYYVLYPGSAIRSFAHRRNYAVSYIKKHFYEYLWLSFSAIPLVLFYLSFPLFLSFCL